MILLGAEVVLLCVAGVNAALLFCSDRETAATNRARREYRYRNRQLALVRTHTPVPSQSCLEIGEEEEVSSSQEANESQPSAEQVSNVSVESVVERNLCSLSVAPQSDRIIEALNESQSSGEELSNVSVESVIERSVCSFSVIPQSDQTTEALAVKLPADKIGQVSNASSSRQSQATEDTTMSSNVNNASNYEPHASLDTHSIRSGGAISLAQDLNAVPLDGPKHVFPPCVFLDGPSGRPPRSSDGNSLYNQFDGSHFSAYHNLQGTRMYPAQHQPYYPDVSNQFGFMHPVDHYPLQSYHPSLQSHNLIPGSMQGNVGVPIIPPINSDGPMQTAPAPALSEVDSSVHINSRVENMAETMRNGTDEGSEQNLQDEATSEVIDETCLGEYARGGLSNRDYKLKVRALLKDGLHALPEPQVIVKYKRLLRALPTAEYRIVKDWQKKERDQL